MRYAVVVNAGSEERLARYLPANYNVVGTTLNSEGVPVFIIAGLDSAGWTLDDYIIPRLGSGLIWAKELVERKY